MTKTTKDNDENAAAVIRWQNSQGDTGKIATGRDRQ